MLKAKKVTAIEGVSKQQAPKAPLLKERACPDFFGRLG
jgi:hypothetical protein